MEHNQELDNQLSEGIENSEDTIERKLEINGEEVIFVGNGVEKLKEEDGIIKVEPSENGSRIFIWRDGGIPCEIGITNEQLAVINEHCSLGMQDSVDEMRVIRYIVGEEEVKEITINKNGQYQIGEGEMNVEDNGHKFVLSVGSTNLIVDGFGEKRRIRYSEKLKDSDYDTILDILSKKDINAVKRAEALKEFQRRAAEINGDRHGLARGVARILTDNDVKLVLRK
jgi:hypothetical protein